MSDQYHTVVQRLRRSYDAAVDERAASDVPAWKHAERGRFLDLLRAEGRSSMLDIGAGTGVHARFFADAGIDVLCIDPSRAMVSHCSTQGLRARHRDVMDLRGLGRFDAAWAMNSLLHVPAADLPAALRSVRSVLEPGGLVFVGQYGGVRRTGDFDDDHYTPKRFFSWLTDGDLFAVAAEVFIVERFTTVDIGVHDGTNFQSALLRNGLDPGRH